VTPSRFYAKALDELHWVGARTILGAVLRSVADLIADDDAEAAAVLHGASDALAPGFVVPRDTAKAHERALAALEKSLNERRRNQLQARGAAMSEDQAVAYAHEAISSVLDHWPTAS